MKIRKQIVEPGPTQPKAKGCLDDDLGDGSLIRAALIDISRARGMSRFASDTGISREGLYLALGPDGNPEFTTVMKVSKSLGLRLHAEAAPR